jgi:hypothetical protein
MLEEDSQYLRNDLDTRTATYWLHNTWEYLSALLRALASKDAHYVLIVRRTYKEDNDMSTPRGL